MFKVLSDRDAFGYPKKYRSAVEAGIAYSVIPRGYSLWLDADDISGVDGDSIAEAGEFKQITAGYEPTLKTGANGINNHNALLFGSDDWMTSDTTNVDFANNFTAFCVFNPNFSGDCTLFNQQYSSGDILSLYRSGVTYRDWTIGVVAGATSPNGTAQMLEYRLAAGGTTLRINETDSTIARSPGNASSPLFLAKSQTDGGLLNFQGLISEFIFYEKELTGTELTTVRDYLNGKYNLWL